MNRATDMCHHAFITPPVCFFSSSFLRPKDGLYLCIRSEHHAISDGWSNPVLLDEAMKIYAGRWTSVGQVDAWWMRSTWTPLLGTSIGSPDSKAESPTSWPKAP